MKFFKTGLLLGFVMTVAYLIYCWITYQPEEWQTRKVCKECTDIENGKLYNLKGTVEITQSRAMIFTEYKSKKKYTLLPCDINCDNRLNKWFQDIGIMDIENNVPLYFAIEGEIDNNKQEFKLLNATLLNEQNFIDSNINLVEIKGWTLKEIKQKYDPIEEGDYKLTLPFVTHEFRLSLTEYFEENKETFLKNPPTVKEVTWRLNNTENYTIWFELGDGDWKQIVGFQWLDGSEF